MKKNRKIREVFFLATFLLLSQFSIGQRLDGSFSFSAGYLNLDNSEFQSFLAPQFKELSAHYGLIGGSGYIMLGDFLVGATGQAIFGPEIEHGTQKVELLGGMGFANLGYAFVNTDRLKIYPMMGIGGGTIGMLKSNHGDLEMDEILDNSLGEMKVSIRNLMMDFSAGLDFSPYWKIHRNNKSGGALNLGLRAGYIFGAENNHWVYRGGEVLGGPDFGMSSFYVKVLVGVSGFTTIN